MIYYVSIYGDDNNPGTESEPWRNIQKAADTLVAGDTVYVRAGTYNEQVIIECCGTPSNYITFAAYPGEQPVVDGTGISMVWGEGLLNVGTPAWPDTPLPPRGFYGVEYVVVDGFNVQNSGEWGIRICFSNHIVVRNNQIFDTRGPGISTDNGYESDWDPTHCSYIYCYDNYVGHGVNYGGTGEAISFSRVDHFEIMRNQVIETAKEGIDCKCGANYGIIAYNEVVTPACGIYYDAYADYQHNVWIHSNWVHGDGGIYIGTEMGGTVEHVFIYNNLICNTSNGFGMLGSTGSRININVVNNTYNVGNIAFQLVASGAVIPVGLTIRNNIIVGGTGINFGGDMTEDDILLDHNLFNCDTSAYGADYVIGDPLWVNPSAGDYHLQAGSPAIGTGSILDAPLVDYDGVERGMEIDIGAYEYEGAGQPEICDWIDNKGGASGLQIGEVFELLDSVVFQTPPTGYIFIPTIENFFGVVDYFLGFDGDAKTGCDYFT